MTDPRETKFVMVSNRLRMPGLSACPIMMMMVLSYVLNGGN